MYLLITTLTSGAVDYYGPFPTISRAELYAAALVDDMAVSICWEIKSLTVPHAVVKSISWKEGARSRSWIVR